MRFVRVAEDADLRPTGRLAVEVDGRAIAVFAAEGAVYAIEDRCPHQFAPLHDGILCESRLTCRWHGWTLELDVRKPYATLGLPTIRRYPVEVREDGVYVGVE